MSISTKTGDRAETSTGSGKRVLKSDSRVLVIGTADELAASLGVAKAMCDEEDIKVILHRIQNMLFVLIAEIADPDQLKIKRTIDERDLKFLEETNVSIEPHLPKIDHFIVYGEDASSAQMDLSRAIARRLERDVVVATMNSDVVVTPIVLKVLNRLSDTLYLLARQNDVVHHKPFTPVSYA